MGVEIAVVTGRRPTAPELRAMHKTRVGNRATPVLIVALWDDKKASLCATNAGEAAIVPEIDRAQAERISTALLESQDRHQALRLIASSIARLDDPIPGLRNSGLFALHELATDVPTRSDWSKAAKAGTKPLTLRGRALIEALGYQIQEMAGPELVLLAKGTKRALALLLARPDEIEPASPTFGNVSPVSHALAKADQENLDYVVIAAGATLRVYPVKPGVGTGRRGRTETYIELNLDLLPPDRAGYLWLLFSAEALSAEGSFEGILGKSKDYAVSLGARLRERVYNEVVPALAVAIVKARRLRNHTPERLRETYEMALQVLFRLLFVAYAEDKELLPLNQKSYRDHSLKELARKLNADIARDPEGSGEDFLWAQVQQLWKAVDKGNTSWGVPAYNGGLFSSETPVGSAIAKLSIPDAAFRPALAALLIDETDEGSRGPVDFRSLGVREFGTIYEGLLESELSVAETDLAVDPRSLAYIPAKGKAKVLVPEGEVYLHNASGARKSSGAYYTKDFAVEHLLDHALEHALDDHIGRLDALTDDRTASERFFDFRVADIAMGSGHFLVAAVDRIERRLSNYLAKRSLNGVRDELSRLRTTAKKAVGEEWTGDPVEDTQLLRRQVARRCIYGVDLNPLSVELARLSLWIHTFVPGLPLSFLDGSLVCGNSLVGIATFEEASELLQERSGSLFAMVAAERLKDAKEPIERLARLADATAAEVKEAGKLYRETRQLIRREEQLLTALAASRLDGDVGELLANELSHMGAELQGNLFSERLLRDSGRALAGLTPLHFPIAFPQVFLGERHGFDVILGNPPWEEATVEEDAFWARHFPGLRSMPQRDQEGEKTKYRRARPDLVRELEAAILEAETIRKVLVTGPFPGMGTGDPDFYKAFCWRFWQLVSPTGGHIGVVLPRTALSAKGTAPFRQKVFTDSQGVEVTTLLNTRGWVFDEAEHRYTIGLVAIKRGSGVDPKVRLRGPYASLPAFTKAVREPVQAFYGSSIRTWNDTASLPLLPTDQSAEVFEQLRKSPRLDLNDGHSWRARPQAELHATNDKHLMDLKSEKRPKGFWPVFKGESFDLWTPDTGKYYAWVDPKNVLPELQARRSRSASGKDSAFGEFSREWLSDPRSLPCNSPRLVFRDVTNRTNQRTVIATLVAGELVLTNKAPYLLFPRGSQADVAYLLGVLSSIPLDWYARRFVELNMNFFIFNPLPIPRPTPDSAIHKDIVRIVGSLLSGNQNLERWIESLGGRVTALSEKQRVAWIATLDGLVARLYGLTETQLRHVFETFHEGWDFRERLELAVRALHLGRAES